MSELIDAVKKRDNGKVRELIDAGADVNIKSKWG